MECPRRCRYDLLGNSFLNMTFPVQINVFGFHPHIHAVMEVLAYLCGFQFYLYLRRRQTDRVPIEHNMWLFVGCLAGAFLGSKILAIGESFHEYRDQGHNLAVFIGGKNIVGGLAGGWIGVEIAKRIRGVRRNTGDIYVFPLIVGMSIGRIGCFLTGLDDHTFGIATRLPWGVNFGDGIRRHPTQLYDIVFLVSLGVCLRMYQRTRENRGAPMVEGMLFRTFMLAYFCWRFAVDFIKPHDPRDLWLGISCIQWTSLIGAMITAYLVVRMKKKELSTTSTNLQTGECA